jgi:serine/threonine protein kinase/Tfp pilus assembly protein PilF
MLGQTVSHYRILEKLGEGGMGVVYKALDTKLNRTVALKFLPPSLLVGEDDRRRFVHEARASAALNHPNIATVFEIDESEKQPFIALEYVEGESLTERIALGPVKIEEILSISVEASEALQAAHEKGIIHRDIKSQNIMVTPLGRVKLLDFGLAKLRGATVITKTGSTLGTTAYMSPEQLHGQTVDQRTDLWALGVVIYEMTSGRRPFLGEYDEAVAYQITSRQPDPLTALRTDVPVELERIVGKLLAKNASERYQSATDLLVDLRGVKLTGESGAVTPSRVFRLARLRKSIAWTMALSVLGAACILYYLYTSKPSDQIRSLAVLPFVNLSGVADQEYFADGMTDQLITELCKLHSVRVISRTSAMEFKGTHHPLPEIARTLNVDGIITATVLRSGDRVRINAQLIRGSNDESIWAETYERTTADILELHGAMARAIAQQIRLALTPVETKQLTARRPVHPDAFDLVARGNYLVYSSASLENFEKAKQLMRKASEIDPEYADAQVGIALCVVQSLFFGLAITPQIESQAMQALDRALALDPDNGRAYSLRGQLAWLRGDLDGCREYNKKAVTLDPNNGFILANYGWMLMLEGRFDEGVREAERSVELDPLSHYARCNLMGWYYTVHRYADSRAQALRILELDSLWLPAIDQLYRISYREGKYEEALAHARRFVLLQSKGKITLPVNMAFPEYREWCLKTLARSAEEDVSAASGAAMEFAMFGEKEKALQYLKIAATHNQTGLLTLFYPDFDCLRNDPRFQEIVSAAHLPVASYCTLPGK